MRRSAETDRFGVHRLADAPSDADVILFVENCDPVRHYLEVRRHPVYRAHGPRCFLFSRHDFPIPFLPGVYASISRRWYDPARTRSGFYLDVFDKSFLPDAMPTADRTYLYSFIGQLSTDPVRTALANLSHPDQFVFDTSSYWPYADLPADTRAELETQYGEVARQSRFVLCPRGRGASSIRLFEMMRMGRAPVIISDEWVPPSGPDWSAFSIRVAESDIPGLPALLEARADDAIAMGRRARAAWDEWFSPESAFHRVTNWCLDLQNTQTSPWRTPYRVGRQLAHPTYLRSFMRTAFDYARRA
ncbi:MAG: exostosin family protein [Salinibacter sp.]